MNKETLERIQRETTFAQPTGVARLVGSIHRDPELRGWVTIESSCLPPVPSRGPGGWIITALLAIPTELPNGAKGYAAPWAAIVWNFESGVVLRKLKLEDDPETRPLRSLGDLNGRLDPNRERLLNGKLFQEIDKFASGEAGELSGLAPFYSELMPIEAYPYIWQLAPESKEWLLPVRPGGASRLGAQRVIRPREAEAEPDPEPAALDVKPVDVRSQLDRWISELGELGRSAALPLVTQAVDDARRYLAAPTFRACVVGESQKSKATYVNRLLARSILATTPQTASVMVSGGDADRVQLFYPGGDKETAPLTEESLVQIRERESAFDRASLIHFTLAEPWLEKQDAELFCPYYTQAIPGVVREVELDLSRCDAAVFVVDATSPFGMSEAEFLSEQVVKKRVERVWIVVTNLVALEEAEREPALVHLRDRIQDAAPGIPIVIFDDSKANLTMSDQQQRTYFEKMARRSDRAVWRGRQIAGALLETARRAAGFLKESIDEVDLTREQRQARVEEHRQKLAGGDLVWDQIRLELEQRRQSCVRSVRQVTERMAGDLLESLHYELTRTMDPKGWWTRDLPYRLRREFSSISRRVEDQVLRTVAADYQWLQATVRDRFKEEFSPMTAMNPGDVTPSAKLEPKKIADLNMYRLFSRIGVGLSSLGGFLIMPGAGVAVGAFAGVLNELALSKKLDVQKESLRTDMDRAVNDMVSAFVDEFSNRSTVFYNDLLNDIRKPQVRWTKAKNALLESENPATSESVERQRGFLLRLNSYADAVEAALAATTG